MTIVLGQVDDLEHTDGDDFTQLKGETLLGAELNFNLGDNGSLKGVYLISQDDGSGNYVDMDEDRMHTFGAEIEFSFDDLSVFGAFGQTNYFDGDDTELDEDNTAYFFGASYNGGNWGVDGTYGLTANLKEQNLKAETKLSFESDTASAGVKAKYVSGKGGDISAFYTKSLSGGNPFNINSWFGK